jgi:hypothetical protein
VISNFSSRAIMISTCAPSSDMLQHLSVAVHMCRKGK